MIFGSVEEEYWTMKNEIFMQLWSVLAQSKVGNGVYIAWSVCQCYKISHSQIIIQGVWKVERFAGNTDDNCVTHMKRHHWMYFSYIKKLHMFKFTNTKMKNKY